MCRVQLGGSPKTLISANRNMPSAYQHPEVISDYLKSEIEFNCIACPSKQPSGKWHLIRDLSYPSGASVYDGIPKEICHFTCPGIQEVIDKIMCYGGGEF